MSREFKHDAAAAGITARPRPTFCGSLEKLDAQASVPMPGGPSNVITWSPENVLASKVSAPIVSNWLISIEKVWPLSARSRPIRTRFMVCDLAPIVATPRILLALQSIAHVVSKENISSRDTLKSICRCCEGTCVNSQRWPRQLTASCAGGHQCSWFWHVAPCVLHAGRSEPYITAYWSAAAPPGNCWVPYVVKAALSVTLIGWPPLQNCLSFQNHG